MKSQSILSLPLSLCFALSFNFSHAQIIDASAPGSAPGTNDVNLGLIAPPAGDIFYRTVQESAEPSTGTIVDPFAPFGSRPTTDKTGEDGSVAIRDINGVIIWIDNQNKAVTIPNSSLAVTMYVSNSECLVWENRFDSTYNTFDSETKIVIHRRNSKGAVVSTPVTPIFGTALGTAPITRTPSGYTVITASRNKLRNYLQDFTQYRITFDGQIQKHSTEVVNPDFHDLIVDGAQFLQTEVYDNLMSSVLQATSADGSGVIIDGDNTILWATFAPGFENITNFDSEDPITEELLITGNPLYVTNNRLLLSNTITGTIQEITKTGAGIIDLAPTPYPIPAGVTILQFDKHTIPGSQILFYGINGLNLQLYTINGGLIELGAPLALPASISTSSLRVRNAIDGSLLIVSDGTPKVLWIKADVSFSGNINGLDSVTEIPSSSKGGPQFVSNQEAVVWMNASADLIGGEVPDAIIVHFEESSGSLVSTALSPPIGKHVASPPLYTPDPKSQGWFIKTFQKKSNDSTVIRTYRLQTLETNDIDGDGLFDWQEDALSTDPNNADTDGDGLSDGQEVFPFYFIDGSLTFPQAAIDAQNRGGHLAVLENDIIREGFKRVNGNALTGSSYWLGGQGYLVPPNSRQYRWNYAGLVVPANSVIISPLWAVGYPTTSGGADYLAVNANYQWVTLPSTDNNGYILQFHGSNPRKPDTDLDGTTDNSEYYSGSNPVIVDSFHGVPDLPAPSGSVPFTTKAIATNYYGLVFDPEQGHIGNMTMKVSTAANFTYSFQGLLSSITASGRGQFSSGGSYTGTGPSGLSDVISIDMQYVEQSPGLWVIFGVLERVSGEKFGFELRREKYGKTGGIYPSSGALTMAIPQAEEERTEPLGDAVVTGTVSSKGAVSLSIYLPDGNRATYKGPVLDSDLLAINAISKPTKGAEASLIGPINMASTRPSLHYDGALRLYSLAGLLNNQFVSGIDQQRSVLGSRYVSPSRGFFPISGITPGTFNTRYNLIGGDFDATEEIGTWDANNRINIPGSPTESSIAKFLSKTGLVSLTYTLTDSTTGLKTTANSYAVALQRPKQIRGFYSDAFSTGQFTVTKNDGTLPSITNIFPVSKTVPAANPTEYLVQVSTPGAWSVIVPSVQTVTTLVDVTTTDPTTGEVTTTQEVTEVPWVTAQVVQGGTGLQGSGNGLVKITVQANPTIPLIWQYVTLEIAGIKHKITQNYR